MKTETFDYLIVGAGFAGSVLAERLARDAGKKVLIVDKRNHIAGNAYDHYDANGLLIHKYGPHIFHTNSRDVFDYLTRFTEWRNYQHWVQACVDGQLVPIPINRETLNKLYGLNLSSQEAEAFLAAQAEPRNPVRTSEDSVVSQVGQELYKKFFRGYTRKQWGMDPSELDAQVAARVPVRFNADNRYFTDSYQAMPKHGYTKMFENMLDHDNIKIMLQTDYRDIVDMIPFGKMIYTGPVDEYFDFQCGKLPYRSLEFKHETHDTEWFQQAPVINYPNDYAFTRITEFKYLTGQKHNQTSIVYEFPQAEGDPYYPIPKPENAAIYAQYAALAKAKKDVHFVGRLATYKYYNMDQVVAQALTVYKHIREELDIPGGDIGLKPRAKSKGLLVSSGTRLTAAAKDGNSRVRDGGVKVTPSRSSNGNGSKVLANGKSNGHTNGNGNGSSANGHSANGANGAKNGSKAGSTLSV